MSVKRMVALANSLGGKDEDDIMWGIAEIERLRDELGPLIAVCREFIDRWPTEEGIDNTIQRARAILLDHDLRNPEKQSVNRALDLKPPT